MTVDVPCSRILVVDDDPNIGKDFVKVLGPPPRTDAEFLRMEHAIFGELRDEPKLPLRPVFDVEVALDGRQGHALAAGAIQCGRPHSVAFVDMRMPGWDGLETIAELWAVAPELQVVICTAHSDYGWQEIVDRLGINDRLLILRKPFDPMEVQQLACALSAKWALAQERQLRLKELEEANRALRATMADRLRLERELRQMQKLDALGRLAAKLGHEINNPLAYIKTNIEFLAEALATHPRAADEGEDLLAVIRETETGVERISTLVRELKVFSRVDECDGHALLSEVVDRAIRLVDAQLHPRVRLVQEVALDLPRMKGHAHQLEQVLVNLLVNACHSFGEVGDGEIRIRAERAGEDRVVLEVRDNGSGIREEVLERIFEPFFTTKPIGVGTGLGLAICRENVLALGGTITVESTVGVGTAFRLVLPVHETVDSTSAPSSRRTPVDRTRARILVVDDEPHFLGSLQRTLAHCDIAIASTVDEAAAKYRARPFDIVLCDVLMRDGNGWDLHAELERLGGAHAARMIFMTGAIFHPPVGAWLARVSNPYIEKPVSAAVLNEVIDRHLSTLSLGTSFGEDSA
jgi:two-component system, NtrC family, sensor kinase